MNKGVSAGSEGIALAERKKYAGRLVQVFVAEPRACHRTLRDRRSASMLQGPAPAADRYKNTKQYRTPWLTVGQMLFGEWTVLCFIRHGRPAENGS